RSSLTASTASPRRCSTACASGRSTSGRATPARTTTSSRWKSTSTGWSRTMPDFDYYARKPHDHDHDHEHDAHAPQEDAEGPPSRFEIMSRAMQELLEAKGIVTAEQIRRRIETFEEDFPYRGGRVV